MSSLKEEERAFEKGTSELGGIVQMEKLILSNRIGLDKGCGDGHMFRKWQVTVFS